MRGEWQGTSGGASETSGEPPEELSGATEDASESSKEPSGAPGDASEASEEMLRKRLMMLRKTVCGASRRTFGCV